MISIHALREEGDATGAYCRAKADDFYPRPPRGGRQYVLCILHQQILISIHALREEGDGIFTFRELILPNFYPRPPRGGRRG